MNNVLYGQIYILNIFIIYTETSSYRFKTSRELHNYRCTNTRISETFPCKSLTIL